MKTPARKIWKFLGSLKLAVVLLVMLAAILATATFYESLYDTKTAQHLVYSSPWFAVFLGLLFTNVFCSAASRYPYKSYQTGFVITHLGILILLAGSLQTMLWGVDGQMPIVEGKSNDIVTLDKPVLAFGSAPDALQEIPAELRWSAPTPDNPRRFALGHGVTAVIDTYLHHAVAETRFSPAPQGEPAIRLAFASSRFKMDQWLAPSMGSVTMGLAKVKLHQLPSAVNSTDNQQMARQLSSDQRRLGMLVDGRPISMLVSDLLAAPQPIPGTSYQVRVLRQLSDGEVRQHELVSLSEKPANPCIEVEFTAQQGDQQGSSTLALFGNDSSKNTVLKQLGKEIPIRALYVLEPVAETAPTGPQTKRTLDLFIDSNSKLFYNLDGKVGELTIDKPLATGWMDIAITAKEILASAKSEESYRPFKMRKGMGEGPPPAIRIVLEGARDPGPYWLQQGGDRLQASDADGNPLIVGYGYRTIKVNAVVELLKFEVGYDPGTKNPASYKSTVRVSGVEQAVQMNEPLHIQNYTVYQASYQENPNGGPQTSILAVAYDPGIVMKYLGCIMLVGGIFTMFYLKPYMIGRKKHLARGAPASSRDDENE